jgi:IS4 transposase
LLAKQRRWSRLLWNRFRHLVANKGGYLLIDDTVFSKEHSKTLPYLSTLWSASERRNLLGINVVVLVWTDGFTRVPLDLRFWCKEDDRSKLDLAIDMLRVVKQRWDISPDAVMFDSWYAAAKLLKAITRLGWHWVTKLKKNRLLDGTTPVSQRWKTTYGSTIAQLCGKITALVVKDGDHYLATSRLDSKPKAVKKAYAKRWAIEEVFKILKSELHIESCMARSKTAVKAHAYIVLMAFCQLEQERIRHNISTIYELRATLFNMPVPDKLYWNLTLTNAA